MTDMLERLHEALGYVQTQGFDPGKMTLHAHGLTLAALAREVTLGTNWRVERPSPGTYTKIAGIPVAEDPSLAPSRLVLRYEVEA